MEVYPHLYLYSDYSLQQRAQNKKKEYVMACVSDQERLGPTNVSCNNNNDNNKTHTAGESGVDRKDSFLYLALSQIIRVVFSYYSLTEAGDFAVLCIRLFSCCLLFQRILLTKKKLFERERK